MELISFTNDLFDYEIATLQSQIIQEKKNERTLEPSNLNNITRNIIESELIFIYNIV